MRISSLMMVEDAIRHMNTGLERLSELQTRVASGKLIQAPSDNPTIAVAGLSLRSTLDANQAYIDTGYVTKDWLNANELALKDLVALGTRAYTLAAKGLSDTEGVDERRAIAVEIDGLLQQAVEIGNTQHQGKSIFAGFAVNTQPYVYNGAGAAVTSPLASTADQMRQSIAPGQTPLVVNISGHDELRPLFDALTSVYNALQPAYNAGALQAALGGLTTALDRVKDVRTLNGARQRQLSTEMDRLEQTKIALKSLLSAKEDANMAESISMLTQQETVYKTVLQVGSRAVTPSLFDYLR